MMSQFRRDGLLDYSRKGIVLTPRVFQMVEQGIVRACARRLSRWTRPSEARGHGAIHPRLRAMATGPLARTGFAIAPDLAINGGGVRR
jgi:hypothetical protein